MVAAYTPDALRDMVRTAYSRLRSRGQRRPRLGSRSRRGVGGRARAARGRRRGAALRELGAAGGGDASATRAIERLERCAAAARAPAGGRAGRSRRARRPRRSGGNAKALCTEPVRASTARRSAPTPRSAASTREHRDHTLLRVLLELYGDRYERRQARALGARLRGPRAARPRPAREPTRACASSTRSASRTCSWTSSRTPTRSRTSCSSSSSATTCSAVGDENQSIYGFRNADVEVFRAPLGAGRRRRARREHHGQLPQPRRGARGDRPLLRAGSGATASSRCARPTAPARSRRASTPCVELLVTDRDKGRWDEALGERRPVRRGDARRHAVAGGRGAAARQADRRAARPRAAGTGATSCCCSRATTSMSFYERALEERGIPTHVVGGRGYWAQQQVADLRHWLAALANPLDELAVYSVLASPLGGAVARRRGADRPGGRGAPAATPGGRCCERSDELRELLPPADRPPRSPRFVERFEAERRAAPQVSLETLIDRAVTAHRLRPPRAVAAGRRRGAWPTCAS